jgi:hypothetical protein
MASRTRVLGCTCEHPYQDRVYGVRRRLHNFCDGPSDVRLHRLVYRCTVCQAPHSPPQKPQQVIHMCRTKQPRTGKVRVR